MVRGAELSTEVRAQVVILRETGFTLADIASKLNISVATAYYTIKRAKEIGSYASRRRVGRPKVSSPRTDRTIARIVKQSPKASSLAVKLRLPWHSRNISTRTIRRRLFDNHLKSYTPARKPKLSAKNIKDRIRFCKLYESWSEKDWENVMFSDESTFCQFYSYCRNIRRPRNKRYDLKYVVPTVKQASKVMIWGCMSAFGRGSLWFMPPNTTINGAVYLKLLQEKLPEFMPLHGTNVWQHDGAPCHTTRSVTAWLQQSGYRLLTPWPGNSPDLNVIENIWAIVKRKVAMKNPTSAEDLKRQIKNVWVTDISQELCMKLVHSMPKRIQDVLARKGRHSKY